MRFTSVPRRGSLISALFFSVIFAGCGTPASEAPELRIEKTAKSAYFAAEQRRGMDVVAQSGETALLYDPLTTAIAVEAPGGALWRSIPADADIPSAASDDVRNEIRSAVILHYYDGDLTDADSCGDSVKKNQFEAFRIPDGVRVEYTIGEAQSVQVFPEALTARYVEDGLLPKLSEADLELFNRYYTKQVYDDTDDYSRVEMLKRYPNFAEHDFYQRYVLEQIPVRFRSALERAITSAGLTLEKMEEQYRALGLEYTLSAAPSFFVPVEYRLEDGALTATLRADEITYSVGPYQLVSIDFLPYFGACGKQSGGYMMLPDGAGILVNLNSQSEIPISMPVFGAELNREPEENSADLNTEQCYLPVYGMKRGDNAYLAVLGDGAAQASVKMHTAQGAAALNRVFPSYTLWERQSFNPESLRQGWNFTRYAPKPYAGKLAQTFYFLRGNQADWAGMATAYRQFLFVGREAPKTPASLWIESYGVIAKEETVLGFTRDKNRSLTTPDQLLRMLDELEALGAQNPLVFYHNWNGDPGSQPLSFKPLSMLGGAQALAEINERRNTTLALDYHVLYTAGKPSLLSPLPLRNFAAYSIQNSYLKIGNIQPGSDDDTRPYGLNADGMAARFKAGGEWAAANGFSEMLINDVGAGLYSDFHKTRFITREDFRNKIAEEAARLAKTRRLTITGANAYLLPFVNRVIGIPSESSKYAAYDEEIPFLQAVLRGYVEYSCEPVNLSFDARRQFLKSLEYGAAPGFVLNWADAAVLKNTPYASLSATGFEHRKESVASFYLEYADIQEALSGRTITGHRQLAKNVFETRFSGGVSLIVNYTQTAHNAGGVSVGAESFAVLEGGAPS